MLDLNGELRFRPGAFLSLIDAQVNFYSPDYNGINLLFGQKLTSTGSLDHTSTNGNIESEYTIAHHVEFFRRFPAGSDDSEKMRGIELDDFDMLKTRIVQIHRTQTYDLKAKVWQQWFFDHAEDNKNLRKSDFKFIGLALIVSDNFITGNPRDRDYFKNILSR